MTQGLLTIGAFFSAVLFPWPFTVLVTAAAAFFEPLVGVAIGLFADTLYYTPHAGELPVFTFYGLLLTIIAFFVRNRLRASIMF